MDSKRRRSDVPDHDAHGASAMNETLTTITAVLAEHSRQIETLAAANKVLEERNAALEERCGALHRKSESLERSYGELEVRCSSLERSVQVLKKDVDWTYSAPDIPRSHWIEQGHDEDYADYMVGNIGAYIKHDVERIRNGDEDYHCNSLYYREGLAVLHDDALLPHFKELANAIQLSTHIGEINIQNIELCPSVLGILFPAMEGKVLDMFMSRIRFPAENVTECYEIIAASIRRNHALKSMAWIKNQMRSVEHSNQLMESVLNNRAIKSVVMKNCFNESEVDGCRALTSLMTCGRPFVAIDFDGNGLSGIGDVAAALATNLQLEELSICDNELNDRDAELIAEALKQNTNLRCLYLRGNNITPAGFEGIGTAIYDSSSLNAVASSNHTCWIDCVEVEYAGGMYKRMTPRHRRRRKLHMLLSSRHAEGSNVRHPERRAWRGGNSHQACASSS